MCFFFKKVFLFQHELFRTLQFCIFFFDKGSDERNGKGQANVTVADSVALCFTLIAQIEVSQCFWHHFACTVNWYEGLDRGAPQPRGPPAVCSLRTALLQYTTGYGFD